MKSTKSYSAAVTHSIGLILWTVIQSVFLCQSSDATVLDDIDMSGAQDGIVSPLPVSVGTSIRAQFDKYTRIVAPNGNPIHFLAQSGVSSLQLARSRRIMEFY